MNWHVWLTCLTTLCVALSGMGWNQPVHAADSAQDEIPDIDSSSYCGIYCVYAAMNCYGRHPDFMELLKTKYVGSIQGSSIAELRTAVQDHGLQALPMMGLSRANLIMAKTPIVLHVSLPDSPGQFVHWILFLGMEDGQAKILDAPHRPELVPVADILARWDGVGLYISDQPMSPWWLKMESLLTSENLALAAALLAITALLNRILSSRGDSQPIRPLWISAPAVIVAAGVMAVIWHLVSDDGYVRNQVAVRTVIQQHRPSFLPKLGIPELEAALQDPKVAIVDARFPRDFAAGHIPGAINVPVYTTQVERRKLLGDLPRDARVIVYCQSESCRFDESLGSALVAEGIENVSLFSGGWAQWSETQKRSLKKDVHE